MLLSEKGGNLRREGGGKKGRGGEGERDERDG